jgi:hypothetical protein
MYVNLDCLGRRKVLNERSADPARAAESARELAQLGFMSDAVDFAGLADDQALWDELQKRAVDEGDLFALRKIYRLTKQAPDRQALQALAENAQRLGKEAFAAQAAEMIASAEQEAPSAG